MSIHPIYCSTHGWLLKSVGWLACFWLSLPLTILAQQPADSILTKQLGVGVFGAAMGLHGDTVGVWGDVVFDRADVSGDGVLSLHGYSPAEPALPQRIVAQHGQVQHIHLAGSGKTILLGELRIEKSLTVEKGVFDVLAGKLKQSAACQTRLLRGARLNNQPGWAVQQTASKTRLTNSKRLIGLQTAQTICPFFSNAKPPRWANYRLSNYQLLAMDKPVPPPKGSTVFCHTDLTKEVS